MWDIGRVARPSGTYDHRLRRIGHPVRSAIHKPQIGGLVVGWVTTSESPLLYVLCCFAFGTCATFGPGGLVNCCHLGPSSLQRASGGPVGGRSLLAYSGWGGSPGDGIMLFFILVFDYRGSWIVDRGSLGIRVLLLGGCRAMLSRRYQGLEGHLSSFGV